MTPVLETAPASEPITTAEAREHLKVSGTGQDAEILRFVKAARGTVERYLNRALITQEWKVYYNFFCNEMLLPFPPIQTVDLVQYFDLDGNEQTLSASSYWVTKGDPSKLVRRHDVTYPDTQYGRPDAVTVTITTGYGDNPTDVPEEIRNAIKLVLTDLYEQRGTIVLERFANKIPSYLTDLCHSYKIYQF